MNHYQATSNGRFSLPVNGSVTGNSAPKIITVVNHFCWCAHTSPPALLKLTASSFEKGKFWPIWCNEGCKFWHTFSWVVSLSWCCDIMGVVLSFFQLWNAFSEASLGVYRGHSGWVHCVAFSKDGCKLISASDDETIKVKCQWQWISVIVFLSCKSF